MENMNDILQENIRSLVNGELDEPARKTLLGQAQADPRVADELAFGRSLARALRHRELTAARAVLSAVMAEEGFPPPGTTGGGRRRAWTGAAVLVALLLAGAWFWADSAGVFDSPTRKIGRAALQPLENVLFLPNDGPALADLQSGMAAYEAGQYAEAARRLDAYARRNPDNAVRVYLGVAHLMSGQAKKAIPPLAVAAQSSEPPIREAGLWYLALAYLENDDPGAARQALESIPPDGIYGAQARELLKKLK